MNHSNIAHAVASGVAVLLMSACAAGVGIGAEPLEAKADIGVQKPAPDWQPGTDNPYCQFDQRGRKVDVFGLGTRVKVKTTRGLYHGRLAGNGDNADSMGDTTVKVRGKVRWVKVHYRTDPAVQHSWKVCEQS